MLLCSPRTDTQGRFPCIRWARTTCAFLLTAHLKSLGVSIPPVLYLLQMSPRPYLSCYFFLHCAHRSILWKFSHWSLTPSWTVLVRVLQKVMTGRQMCGDICHTPKIAQTTSTSGNVSCNVVIRIYHISCVQTLRLKRWVLGIHLGRLFLLYVSNRKGSASIAVFQSGCWTDLTETPCDIWI